MNPQLDNMHSIFHTPTDIPADTAWISGVCERGKRDDAMDHEYNFDLDVFQKRRLCILCICIYECMLVSLCICVSASACILRHSCLSVRDRSWYHHVHELWGTALTYTPSQPLRGVLEFRQVYFGNCNKFISRTDVAVVWILLHKRHR